MKAIILAAGQGSRLAPLTEHTPKSLLPYLGIPVLRRLVTQLRQCQIQDIYIVVGYLKQSIIDELSDIPGLRFIENDRFKDDVNIYSMKLALDAVIEDGCEDTLLLEADVLCEYGLVKYISGTDFENRSVWFVSGPFHAPQYGGILKTDGRSRVTEIRLVPRYEDRFCDYHKLTGLTRISGDQLTTFQALLHQYAAKTINQYYLVPWMENLDQLPCFRGDAAHFQFATFNTAQEYEALQSREFDIPIVQRPVRLVPIQELVPIEDYDPARLPEVASAVVANDRWLEPLLTEGRHGLILDGHHRYALAKSMNLSYVPVIEFDYAEVPLWSLREDISLDREKVAAQALSGELFPFKTVKHKFPDVDLQCDIAIGDLK